MELNKQNNHKPAARVVSYELKATTTPPLRRRDVQSADNDDYILGSIKFLHLDSSDMGHREREFIIIKHDDDPGQTLEYLTRKWNLGAPKLVISLMGGFRRITHVTSSVTKTFRRELVNAVLSTGAWLTTGGLHSGMTKDVGEALRDYAIGRAMAEHRSVVAMGIAPLSILKHKQKLTSSQMKAIKYKIDPSDVTNAQLDPNHTHFIIVDDEGMDKTGVEIDAQCKLLREIAGRMIEGSSTAGIPVVCIVLGGGYKRIRAVHNAVVKNKIPVIILEGSGGAADVLAYAYKHMSPQGMNKFGTMSMSLTASLSKAMAKNISEFNALLRAEFGMEKIESMYDELIECCREISEKSSLVTLLSLNVSQGNNASSNIEETILNALLKGKSGSQYGDQLHLAAVLNRIDLAQQLLKEETCLKATEVRQSLRFALANGQVKLVQLFLNKGLSLYEYLTVRELTSLYKMIKKDTLLYELLDVELEKRDRRPVSRWVTLRDVGNVIKRLTSWSYRPLYLRDEIADHSGRFPNPSRELFIWAVLQGRLDMASLFWREGKAPIGGALVASKLLKEMAKEEHDMHESRRFTKYEEGGSLYEELAVGVLDECYLSDRKRTSLIIVRTLKSWGSTNCLDLANSASNLKFIAHPAVQNMLKEFWMGKLSLGNALWKVWLCLVFPPLLLVFRLKLKEEEADPLLVKSLPRGTSKGTILIRKPVRRMSTNVHGRSRRWGLPSFLPRGVSKDENASDDTSHPREFGANFTGLPIRELNRRRAVKLDEKGKKHEEKTHRVSLARRVKLFFLVPLVIFLYNVFSTFTFLGMFSYVLLKGFKPKHIEPIEYVLLGWFVTQCTEIIRQIITEDAKTFTQRLRTWISNFWNIVDIAKSVIFIVGYVIRLSPETKSAGRIVLAVSLIIFYMRLLHIFSANKHLGPKLIMIQKMFADLLVFICILFVFLVAYGVSSEAILHPGNTNVTDVLESIFYRPYIQMFGEGLLEDANNSDCMDENCPENVWFGTILLAIYLFLSNVLLLNLLIAMFNYTFTAVQENTDVYWKYQRYKLINEYYKRPPLPPPLIIISHIYLFIIGLSKSILKVCKKCRKSMYCSCCRERRVFDPDIPPLTQASANEMTIWESVKGEDYLAKEREKLQLDVNKRLKNTDRRITELSGHLTKLVADMSSVHEQLGNMQSLLLEKLGPPKDDSDDGSLDGIPDAPTLALYEKSGRRSPRHFPYQKTLQQDD